MLDINNISENDLVEDIVKAFVYQGHEGAFWDFKREWPNKINVMHDIICMANNLEKNTSYIICGLDEENGYKAVDVTNNANRKNTQQLNDLLQSKSWAFASPIVEVIEINIDDCVVDVIVIQAEHDMQPYYLTERCEYQGKKLQAGAIYTRIKDSNTAVDKTASAQDTQMLWRRHFGIDLKPLDRLPQLLKEKEMWAETQPHPSFEVEVFTEAFYHTLFPGFTFMKIPEPKRDGWEYYMLVCPYNRTPDWYRTCFYYNNTLLVESFGVYIDHHFFPVPEPGAFPNRDEAFGLNKSYYYYYLEGSLNDRLEQLCLSIETKDEVFNHNLIMNVIPRYKSVAEKTEFEEYLEDNLEKFIETKAAVNIYFSRPEVEFKSYRESYFDELEEQAKTGAALVKLLAEYRFYYQQQHNVNDEGIFDMKDSDVQ